MQSSANAAWVGLVALLALVLLGGVTLLLRGFSFGGGDRYFVLAAFDDVSGISRGMLITASGLEVGRVEKILPPEGGWDRPEGLHWMRSALPALPATSATERTSAATSPDFQGGRSALRTHLPGVFSQRSSRHRQENVIQRRLSHR